MISILSRIFVRDYFNYGDATVRRAYGMLCSVVGILLNVALFAGKYFAGIISGSIAITADAFNNLSDAGSSVITLFGFKFSGMKADREHPFGHGRIEYIAGFIVSLAILLMSYELGKTSVYKIISPTAVDFSVLSMVILAVSVIVKIYMYIYNKKIAGLINSQAMTATAVDSISDAAATFVVMLSMALEHYFHINIDGYCGVLVALFILKAGFSAARDTIGPLLGRAPDPVFVAKIEEIVMSHSAIVGIHDLVVHDYGPSRLMVTLHAEVAEDGDILEIHEQIDHIENEIFDTLSCEAVIHMDPISTKNSEVLKTRELVAGLVREVDPNMSIHDFRMVVGEENTNLIFDAVLPNDSSMTQEQAKLEIVAKICAHYSTVTPVVHIDTDYVR